MSDYLIIWPVFDASGCERFEPPRQPGIFNSTPSSFSGRPLSPPFCNWRSHNHHPNVSPTTSTLSKIANAAAQAKTGWQSVAATSHGYGGADSPCPAWLSAATQLPNIKIPVALNICHRVSLSNRWAFPKRNRAFTVQYKKRVTTLPNESPAKTPDGCCRDWMTG